MHRAALLAIAADLVLAIMDGLVKGVAGRYPILEVTFLRFACGSLFAALMVAAVRPGWPSPETVRYNALRSVLVVFTAGSFFYALSVLPFAETVALSFLSPVFMVLFSALLLKESIDSRILVALAAGFAGMLVMAGGHLAQSQSALAQPMTWQTLSGIVAVLFSAVMYALVIVLLRVRATRDRVEIIVLFQNVGPALLLAVPAALVWTTPTSVDLARFVLIGLLGVIGHLLLARAFASAEAARLAPLHYMTLVWSAVIGYVAFSEIPGTTTLIGAGLIIVGTLYAQRRR